MNEKSKLCITFMYFPSHNNTTKGQLISKGLFGILNSPKKRTKKFDFTTMIHTSDRLSFVRFFGRI